MIDYSKLQTFIIAAETLSFSETAKQLHVTQPNISQHIKALEKDFGVMLFNRLGHNIRLTEAGRLLLPRARKLVRQSIELQELISSNSETIAGHLRIACSTTAGKYILPQLAARFCNRFPNIHVSILACTPENIATKLLEENANLAVVSSEHIGTGLEVQEFFTDTIDLVVPAVHPWTSKPYIEPQDLLEEKLIIREVTSGTRRVMVDEFAKHDIALDDLNIFLELGNAEAIVYTVGAGYGVSFVSRLAISFPLAHGYVATVPINGWHLKRTIYMVRKEIRSVNRVQEVFWGFIHDPENADLLSLPGSY